MDNWINKNKDIIDCKLWIKIRWYEEELNREEEAMDVKRLD